MRRHDDVDAGGARHLRQALHRAFDVLAGEQHEIGHLVDHDDDERQRVGGERLLLENRAAGILVEARLHPAHQRLALGLGLGEALVVALDVAHAELGHERGSGFPSRAPSI